MICVDTMVLIWGLQRKAHPSQERMIDLTARFISHLDPKETVMVPSVVLSEYLVGFSSEAARQEQFAAVSRRFFVPAFHAQAAALAAELLRSPAAVELRESVDRRCLKADAQIIATAITNGAGKIVTANCEEYRKLAGHRIEVTEVPS